MMDNKEVNRFVLPAWSKKFPGVQLQHFNTAGHRQYLKWIVGKKDVWFDSLPIEIKKKITLIIS